MKAFIKSLSYALNGIIVSISEKHIRIHLAMMICVIAAGFYFNITQTEWLICCLLFGLVISLEIINTAIEKIVNIISPEKNDEAGKIKDLAAGAVLVAAITAAICGALIFSKYLTN